MAYNPQDLAQIQARAYQNAKAGFSAPKPQQVGGAKGLLLNFLPTIAGGAGAALGTLAGPAGTIAGGAAGSGLGEFLRQKLSGQDTNLGSVARESIFGAIPGVFKGVKAIRAGEEGLTALKGAKTAKTALDAERAIEPSVIQTIDRTTGQKLFQTIPKGKLEEAKALIDSTEGGIAGKNINGKITPITARTPESMIERGFTEAPSSQSFLDSIRSKTGTKLTEAGSGLKVGQNVGDINKLEQQAQFMKQYAGAPEKQLRMMSNDMKALSGQVDDILSKTKIEIPGTKVRDTLYQGVQDPTHELFHDLDLTEPRTQKVIESYLGKFDKLNNAKEVNDQLKTVQKLANKAQVKLSNPNAAPLTAQETAALAIKRSADNVLSDIPEIKPLKQHMAQIFEVNPSVATASKQAYRIPFVGAKSREISQGAKALMSKAGAIIQPGPAEAEKSASFLKDIFKASIPQQVTRTGASLFGIPVGTAQPDGNPGADLPGNMAGMLPGDYQANLDAQFQQPEDTAQPQDFYSRDNIKAMIAEDLKTGGKNVDKLLKLYETFGKDGSGGGSLNSTAAGIVSDLQTGIENIRELGQDFAQNDANNPIIGKIRSLNPLDTGAQTLQAKTNLVKQLIGKALEGGVLRKEDEVKYQKILPTLNDTDTVAQYKIQTIADDLQRKLQLYTSSLSGGSGGTDLATLGL